MKAVKIGILGYGFSAQTFHIPFISNMKEYEFSGIYSSKQDLFKKNFPNVPCYSDVHSLFNRDDIEAVIVTTPNEFHYSHAKMAILAGKHVILEKPVVVDPIEGEELLSLSKKHNKKIIAFQNRRWDSDFLSLIDIIKTDRLGTISHFESHMDRYRPVVRQRWREGSNPGAGLLYDLGSHLIDQALVLFGPPESINADIRLQRPGANAVDYFHLILNYKNFPAILHASSYVLGPKQRYIVHGSKASYIKYGIDPQEQSLKNGASPLSPGFGEESPEIAGKLYTELEDDAWQEEVIKSRKGNYLDFFKKASACIREEGSNPVPFEEALNVIKIIASAIKFSQTGL